MTSDDDWTYTCEKITSDTTGAVVGNTVSEDWSNNKVLLAEFSSICMILASFSL